MQLAFPSHPKPARLDRLVIAGLAVAGAALFALGGPAAAGPLVQQHDVKLVDQEVDFTTFLSNTEANLATLQAEGTAASAKLTDALTNVSDHFNTQISTAITGFDTGVNNALFGGFYGGDDGYVFGLFGGEPINSGPTPGITGSLIDVLQKDYAAISTNPNGVEQLYSDLNNYELEVLDHTAKPLLAPLLDETSRVTVNGVPTVVTNYSIPAELSQIQTNLINTFGTYNELKSLSETLLSPQISGVFQFTQDLDNISAAMTAGDSATVMTDLNNLGSDTLNAIFNGFEPGSTAGEGLFPGLVSAGSFLDELYTTWTTQFITAFGSLAADSASAGASEAVTSSAPDLFSGLLSF